MKLRGISQPASNFPQKTKFLLATKGTKSTKCLLDERRTSHNHFVLFAPFVAIPL